jgi:hypothetical protein
MLDVTEMRVKNEYVHHKCISAAMGLKIAAAGLEVITLLALLIQQYKY